VLALAANADDYWTTQEIAEFVGRSRRQVYRILAKHRCPTDREALAPSRDVPSSSIGLESARLIGAPTTAN
jgi:hypothetical protein